MDPQKSLRHLLIDTLSLSLSLSPPSLPTQVSFEYMMPPPLTPHPDAKSDARVTEHRRHSTHIKQLFLCSLLGNYEHCAAESRPVGLSRLHLTRALRTEKLVLHWIQVCPFLLLNALRDYMIHVIRHDPALRETLATLIQFDAFSSIVNRTMNRVRQYLHDMLRLRTTALFTVVVYAETAEPRWLEECQRRVALDLNCILQESHVPILTISYRRPALHSWQLMLALRRQCPMIQRDHTPLVATEENEEEEEEIEDVRLDGGLNAVLRRLKAPKPNPNKRRKTTGDPSRVDPLLFLSELQFRALSEVVQRENPLRTFALDRLVKWLPHFGVGPEACQYSEVLFQHYHAGSLSIEKLKDRFDLLQVAEPHCYNLLQLGAQIIRDATRRFFLFQLPHYMVRYQIEAVQSRSKHVQGSDFVLPSSIHFVYCSICERIYSLLRDFNTVFTRTYRYGLRDVSVEYSTGEMYCRQNRKHETGKCSGQPLTQISLLGRMLVFAGKMICPQVGCGALMVLDPDRCPFTERGPMCCDCVAQRNKDPQLYRELFVAHCAVARTCALCTENLVNLSVCYMYPKGIYLCSKHHFPRFLQEFQLWWQTQITATVSRGEVVKKVSALYLQFRDAKNQRNQAFYSSTRQ
jgi:hypothetical protein